MTTADPFGIDANVPPRLFRGGDGLGVLGVNRVAKFIKKLIHVFEEEDGSLGSEMPPDDPHGFFEGRKERKETLTKQLKI